MIFYVILNIFMICAQKETLDSSETVFQSFVAKYNKKYSSEREQQQRKTLFYQSMERIANLTSQQMHGSDVRFGIDKFSDWSQGEKNKLCGFRLTGDRTTEVMTNELLFSPAEVAEAEATPIDWRDKGLVTPIKDQGKCGSCWAFSTIVPIEGAWAKAGNPLTSLSEQQLIDCACQGASCTIAKCPGGVAYSTACNGGYTDETLDWVVKNGGSSTEHDYPYLDHDSAGIYLCNTSACHSPAAHISKRAKISPDEGQINAALHKYGPLSVAVYASKWFGYKGGIMTQETCWGTSPNHGVGLVGYGIDGDKPYWIVKNSWGTKFGEKGYIRLAYGTKTCAIQSDANYVVA